MNRDFLQAMKRVGNLTRSGRLAKATSLIQEALRAPNALPGQPSHAPASADAAASDETRPEGRAAFPRGTEFTDKLRGPLGQVVSRLRAARPRPAQPFAAPGNRPQTTVSVPLGARYVEKSYANHAGERAYKLYVPANRQAGAPALIVMLHGCTQNADDFALGTRMNVLAEEHGFLVAYPEQPRAANPSSCWNWFQPRDQVRGDGEPSLIAGVAQQTLAEFAVDPDRVFVAGLSAGGAMAAIMGATYSDIFSAVGIHSGLAAGSASDVAGAFAAMRGSAAPSKSGSFRSGEAPRPTRMIIFQGDSDRTVHPSNAARIVKGSSSPFDPVEVVRGVRGGKSYTRTLIGPAGEPRLEKWMIEGAGHAWSGGSPDGSFTDPDGPDASREFVSYFLGQG